jgi:hypothetical protein
MEKAVLTPEESLLLITKTIEHTKKRFKESGHIYIFWGTLMFVVTIIQYYLIHSQSTIGAGFPALLYPLGGIYTFIYYRRESRNHNLPRTIIGNVLQTLGILLGLNFMILGFAFWSDLGNNLVPIFLIFLSFWTIITGISIRFSPLYVGGIIVNLIAFAAFFIDWQYHFLLLTAASVVAFIIPGILLNMKNKKDNV